MTQSDKLANGKPTFDRIWTNLIDMRKLDADFNVIIRIHARKDNVFRVKTLLEEIEAEFQGDDRFFPRLHPLENLGGDGVKSIDLLSHDEFIGFINSLDFSKEQGLNDYQGDTFLPGNESAKGHESQCICYACKPNSFHIRADGSVGKCTVALDKDYNQIGHLDESGKITIDRNKMSLWTNGLISLDRREMSCPLPVINSKFHL